MSFRYKVTRESIVDGSVILRWLHFVLTANAARAK